MKTTDFTKPVSSHKLNENMFKSFGVKVNLDKYSREQLEDYRNLLRTKISQHESKANFNDLLTNEDYQKDKHLVGILNARIKEMLGESIELLERSLKEGKKAKKDYDGDGKVETPKDEVWGSRAKAAKKAGKPFEESAKPDYIDLDKDGDKKEPMKKAAKEKKIKEETGKFDKKDTTWTDKSGKKHPAQRVTRKTDQLAQGEEDKPKEKKVKESLKGGQTKLDVDKDGKLEKSDFAKLRAGKKKNMKESQHKDNVKIVNESLRRLLAEDEEGKAKAITAGTDMVNDFTSWMTRVGQYQTKSMIELSDAIRANFGQQESETFKQSVAPALESALNALTQVREQLSNAVAVLAGGESMSPMGDMGMDSGMDTGMEPGMDSMNAGNEEVPSDFGAADAAAGGMEMSGREQRESRQLFAQKLSEAHSIISKLSK